MKAGSSGRNQIGLRLQPAEAGLLRRRQAIRGSGYSLGYAYPNMAESSITTMARRSGRCSAIGKMLSTYSWSSAMKIAGAAIAHLIVDLRRCRGRIDAVDDGAERLRGEIADHPFLADVAHDGDTLAALKTEALQRARGHARPARHNRASAARDKCRNVLNGRRPNPGSRRARSHNRCGAVVRRKRSAIDRDGLAVIRRSCRVSPDSNSIAQSNSISGTRR